MNKKPTPGPMVEETLSGDFDVITNEVHVARFYQHGPISRKEAEANARAWVAGRNVLSKLPRLRAAYLATKGAGTTSDQWAEFYDALHDVIDEAKP